MSTFLCTYNGCEEHTTDPGEHMIEAHGDIAERISLADVYRNFRLVKSDVGKRLGRPPKSDTVVGEVTPPLSSE